MKKILLFWFVCMLAMPLRASHELEHQFHVEHWIKTLEKHPFVLIRVNAARFLGDLQDRVAVPTLIRALEDKHADVVLASIKALGKLGDESAIKPLYEVSIRQQDTLLSREATRSIAKIESYLAFKENQQLSNQAQQDVTP